MSNKYVSKDALSKKYVRRDALLSKKYVSILELRLSELSKKCERLWDTYYLDLWMQSILIYAIARSLIILVYANTPLH